MSQVDTFESTPLGPGDISALIGKGCEFEGKLVFEGIVRIDGSFSGEIFSRDTLVLGPDSRVRAKIEADVVIVAGHLEGDLLASSRVEIRSTGYVKGSISSPVLKIEEGGIFEGRTKMLTEEI
ncbi:MAG: polymer-forming cytoskeletal protein [Proteobacteria bacterium]|nr:polymer-forming cytoskeletal protein [Pseudomonadota bacterium]